MSCRPLTLRRGMVLFALLSALAGVQNLGTPRNAAPDEYSHAIRAAGIVRGEVFGVATSNPAERLMTVPRWTLEPDPTCYAFHPETPASCSSVSDTTDDARLSTTAANYPPLAHLIAGLGTVAPLGARGHWLARQFLAEACVALLSLSLLVAGRRRVLSAAVWLAATPMVVFLLGTMNPSGLFVSAAIALWTGLLVAGEEYRSDATWLAVAGASIMLLTRNDGPVFVSAIAALVTVTYGLRWLGRFVRASTTSQRAVAGSSVTFGVGWALLVGAELVKVPVDLPASNWRLAAMVVNRTGSHLREAFGVLGWLDTTLPDTAYVVWLMCAGALVLLAWASNCNGRRGLAVACVACVLLPFIFEYARARNVGLYWQGRYQLPLFVGVVLLAAALVDRSDRDFSAIRRPIVWLHGLVLVMCFGQTLRRFSVGADGSIWPGDWKGSQLPVPGWSLLALEILIVAGLCSIIAGRAGHSPTQA